MASDSQEGPEGVLPPRIPLVAHPLDRFPSLAGVRRLVSYSFPVANETLKIFMNQFLDDFSVYFVPTRTLWIPEVSADAIVSSRRAIADSNR